MSVVRLKKLSFSYDDRPLLREVHLRVARGERVALIGANGTGKSTILKLIVRKAVEVGQGTQSTKMKPMSVEARVEGDVELDGSIRVGYFSQFSRLDDDRSIDTILLDTFSEIRSWETELAQIDEDLAAGPDADTLDRLLDRQATLFEWMTQRDGWSYTNRIDTVLTKLGFDDELRARPIKHLSGGWRNRASLAQILLEEPDLLILDEPTNYLDVEGIQWLETWVHRLPGAALIVSHDRHFLDATVSRMVEIQNHRLHEYPGSYASYVRAKAKAAKTLEKEFRHEAELLFFEDASLKARKAISTKKLARAKAQAKKAAETPLVDRVVSSVYADLHIPQRLLDVQDLTVGRDGKALIRDLTFTLERGDRLIVLGRNGSGKSTLLATLTKELEPQDGEVRWKSGVRFAHFTSILEELDPEDRLFHSAMAAPQQFLSPHEMPTHKSMLRFMHMLGFSEHDLQLRVKTLSGGQKARLALLWCLTSGPSVIVLDEPTNHLDMRSTQIMERALTQFPGAVLAVSHDRLFVDKVANRLLVLEESGDIALVQGTWAQYEAARA